MPIARRFPRLIRCLLLGAAVCGSGLLAPARAADLVRLTWRVGEVEREALVHVPKDATRTPAPLVFFFHGRSGKMDDTARRHALDTHWPEAIVVFAQGLPTPALRGDGSQLQPGWQTMPGQFDDRDLRFFDVMLAGLRRDYRVDERRIYATGTSNGGGMVFLLWSQRPDAFAAFAPTCTAARALATSQSDDAVRRLRALPSLHVVGDKDTTIPPAEQLRTIALLREARRSGPGVPWGDPPDPLGTLHPSPDGAAPLVIYLYPGGHGLPSSITPVLVRFFQAHPRP